MRVRLQTMFLQFAPDVVFNGKRGPKKIHESSPCVDINFKSWMGDFRWELLGGFRRHWFNPVFRI